MSTPVRAVLIIFAAVLSVVLVVAAVFALTGLYLRSQPSPPAPAPQPAPIATDWHWVKRSGPDDHGVVCYWQGSNTLSCVKVQP